MMCVNLKNPNGINDSLLLYIIWQNNFLIKKKVMLQNKLILRIKWFK